jgi:hypothetical protein
MALGTWWMVDAAMIMGSCLFTCLMVSLRSGRKRGLRYSVNKSSREDDSAAYDAIAIVKR